MSVRDTVKLKLTLQQKQFEELDAGQPERQTKCFHYNRKLKWKIGCVLHNTIANLRDLTCTDQFLFLQLKMRAGFTLYKLQVHDKRSHSALPLHFWVH